jgi:putative hydrolase of the HAD superfamily
VRHVKAVCLDLDDTLWDLGPVIRRAEQATHGWFAAHHPAIVRRFTPEDVRRVRREVEALMPGQEHDLPRLRRATFARIAREAGYAEGLAAEVGEAAFREFQRVRNDLAPFADVLPALGRLARRGPVVALTNGTADLAAIGLDGYFTAVFMASDVGAAKPDPRAFQAVCAALGLAPAAVLHAGDHPEKDVAAARAVGMPAVWVDRGLHEWPRHLAPAEHVVADMVALADLLDP